RTPPLARGREHRIPTCPALLLLAVLLRRGLFRRSLLRRGLLGGGLLRGGLLRGGFLLGGRRGAAIREELECPRFGEGGYLIALPQRRVRRAVGHVGAESAIFDDDGFAGLRVVAELRERWSRRRPAAAAFGLRVDLEGLFQGDLEDLIL